jgi:MFS family permease
LGKRKTIILACIIAGFGQIWMGVAPNLIHAALSLVVLNFGGSLKSGTFEAMIYDTLKEQGEEKKYMKILSNMNAIRLGTLAVVAILGGLIYKYNNGLPFVLNGLL